MGEDSSLQAELQWTALLKRETAVFAVNEKLKSGRTNIRKEFCYKKVNIETANVCYQNEHLGFILCLKHRTFTKLYYWNLYT